MTRPAGARLPAPQTPAGDRPFGLVRTAGRCCLLPRPRGLFPTAIALGYGEPFWPFLAAGAIAAAVGFALERVSAATSPSCGSREGYLVVALTWLARGPVRGAPVPVLGRPAARSSGRCPVRGDVRVHHGRCVGRRRCRDVDRSAVDVAPVHAVARRDGRSSCSRSPCSRGYASAGGSCSSRSSGTGGRSARRPDPLDGTAAVAPLRRPHGA